MTVETRIGQTFPELSAKIQPAYRDVSVRQLLAHAGGIPPYRTRESLRWMLTLKGTPSEQRYALVERVLTEPPRFEPGTRHEYSNAGGRLPARWPSGSAVPRIGNSSSSWFSLGLEGTRRLAILGSRPSLSRGDTFERFSAP